MAKRKKRGRSAAFMRSINPNFNKSRSTKRRIKQTMAKRKKTRSNKSKGLRPMAVLIGGGIYGAFRAKLSNALLPITAKIPLGSVSDEAVMFGVSYLVNKKFGGSGILKDATNAGMAVEAARIGEALIDGTAFNTSSNGAAISTYSTLG